MTLLEAVKVVEAYLQQFGPNPKIYLYNDGGSPHREWAGVLVAEVDFHEGMGGCSYMQVDVPWGIAVCGQAERAILSYVEDWDLAEQQEELERLGYCLKGDT